MPTGATLQEVAGRQHNVCESVMTLKARVLLVA